MIGPHLARYAIALEQEARADHVDRADDDRGCCRIVEPFSVIGICAAERRNGECAVQPKLFLQTLCVASSAVRSFSASAVA